MDATHPRFFGYGSLVNLATHAYPDPQPARLPGWRRVWKQAANRPVAFLSVERHDSVIHGVTAHVPDNDWAALDAREHAYLRRDVSAHFTTPTAIYEANPDHTAPPTTGHPILLSYLDVVFAGYATLMGVEGPKHLMDTTTGWGPVLDDRADPIYPRAQPLDHSIRLLVDAALDTLAVPVKPAERAFVDALRRAAAAAGP